MVRRVLELREAGTDLKRQAVLFRASHHSILLEADLARHNIPFVKYGGLKFLEAAHVKDLLSFLRLAENPRDVRSWRRIERANGVAIATSAARTMTTRMRAFPRALIGAPPSAR